jgi:hypothetical protein
LNHAWFAGLCASRAHAENFQRQFARSYADTRDVDYALRILVDIRLRNPSLNEHTFLLRSKAEVV